MPLDGHDLGDTHLSPNAVELTQTHTYLGASDPSIVESPTYPTLIEVNDAERLPQMNTHLGPFNENTVEGRTHLPVTQHTQDTTHLPLTEQGLTGSPQSKDLPAPLRTTPRHRMEYNSMRALLIHMLSPPMTPNNIRNPMRSDRV